MGTSPGAAINIPLPPERNFSVGSFVNFKIHYNSNAMQLLLRCCGDSLTAFITISAEKKKFNGKIN